MITPEDFPHLKEGMRRRYDAIRSPVYCRCLNQDIHFNARGFHHLLYNGLGKARTIEESTSRLLLVPLIIPALKSASDCSYERRNVYKGRGGHRRLVIVEMWGIEALVGNRSIPVKVVLRREEEGNIIFWSVMRSR